MQSYEAPPAWRDTALARFQVHALVQTLNAELLSHDSATATLERWCIVHRMAEPPKIVADRVGGPETRAPVDLRGLLALDHGEEVRHRRVDLRCGDHVLSHADNWYVPGRLSPGMNAALDSSDIPFGHAVRALGFRRRTLSAQLLWSPLPEGWDMGAELPPSTGGILAIPDLLLEHRAVLEAADGRPFSLVIESYTKAILAFPPPCG